MKPKLAIMRQCNSVTDRWADGQASWHKHEMYILHLALKRHKFRPKMRQNVLGGWAGGLKMREWKMRYEQNCRGRKCRSGKYRSRSHAWKMQE